MSDTAGLCGDTDHVLLPLSKHSADTLMYLARLSKGSHLQISPFCYEHPSSNSDVKQVKGWVLDSPSSTKADLLPIGPTMFDGICIVQCIVDEASILDILREADAFKERLGKAVKRIRHRTEKNPERRATWARCRPISTGHPNTLFDASRHKGTGNVVFAPAPSSVPILDSDTWDPELSDNGFVGVFHHWFHGAQDHRLCLYVACRSYLSAACLEFADLVHDMGQVHTCTGASVLLSEEAHWLRRANHRNRCRIITEICSELGLKVQTTRDHNAHIPKECSVAVPDLETLCSDMYLVNEDTIRISNSLSETSMANNGICCMLAPWQGLAIFHGLGGGQVAANFGSAYGRQYIPTVIPRIVKAPENTGKNGNGKSLAFTTGDPVFSRPLQVWGLVDRNVALYTQPELPVDIAEAHITDLHAALDPDIVNVYRQLVRKGSCGNVILMPNLPGIVPNSETYHTFLRFDEAVLCAMASNGWDRSRGFTILVPLATALASMCPDLSAEPATTTDESVIEHYESSSV